MEARLSFAGAVLHGDADLAAKAADQFDAIGANLLAAEASMLEESTGFICGTAAPLLPPPTPAPLRALEKCEGAKVTWIPRSAEGPNCRIVNVR